LQGEILDGRYDVKSISSKLFMDDMFIEGLSWQRIERYIVTQKSTVMLILHLSLGIRCNYV
jgi:hypothetical protein